MKKVRPQEKNDFALAHHYGEGQAQILEFIAEEFPDILAYRSYTAN